MEVCRGLKPAPIRKTHFFYAQSLRSEVPPKQWIRGSSRALLALRKHSRVLRHRRAPADCFGANPVASASGNLTGRDPGEAVRTYHEVSQSNLKTGTFYFAGIRNFLFWSDSVWSSTEGVNIWFDTTYSPARLYFPDGSFWVFGCTSAGTEQDAGYMYPTLIEDSNGNQIDVSYFNGLNTTWPNSSARIRNITDVRPPTGAVPATYDFFYNSDSVPHLTEIVNGIGTGEAYQFSYATQSLYSPFSGTGYSPVATLQGITTTGLGTETSFSYDTSADLTETVLPYGGHLRWAYTTASYLGSRELYEVADRYLAKDAGGTVETTYAFSHPVGDNNLTVHSATTLNDPDGRGQKTWSFNTSGTYVGYASQYQALDLPTNASVTTAYTWTRQTTSNAYYISQTNTTRTETSGSVANVATQVLDQYGNVTSSTVQDWGASTALRTWTNSYFNSGYLRNRLSGSTPTERRQ